MTDPLTTLRAGCQRGEMPTWNQCRLLVRGTNIPSDAALSIVGRYHVHRHLDALAALQEALWPGARIDIVSNRGANAWHYLVGIWLPAGGFVENVVGAGRPCPTLACAWLDAILAGLQENGGRDG